METGGEEHLAVGDAGLRSVFGCFIRQPMEVIWFEQNRAHGAERSQKVGERLVFVEVSGISDADVDAMMGGEFSNRLNPRRAFDMTVELNFGKQSQWRVGRCNLRGGVWLP